MQVALKNLIVSLPMPIFVVVEDVGWWRGKDGSAYNEPFRNGFIRDHCLDDYRTLARLAKRLNMRVTLGMVLGEWDRNNLLRNVAGATWMGSSWDNRNNCGPWLDEAAQFLRDNNDCLEIGCHGLCHEFWRDGRMERSEFHDEGGRMRERETIKRHLEVFAEILAQHALPDSPKIFLPPALLHSFGNGKNSMQAILHDFGIRYVVTSFSRARTYSTPLHEKITWECGVGLLERGLSPVPWHEAAAHPIWDFNNPILPLHWSNLLHPDPEKNFAIVDGWADLLLDRANTMEYILAEDFASCWSQAAAYHLVKLTADAGKIILDL
ncbi:MAG: hypothetical protein V2B20_23885, partial [Pseudomonadota bacterium]